VKCERRWKEMTIGWKNKKSRKQIKGERREGDKDEKIQKTNEETSL
jgi:hypothetical protein